jgi:hypothetical protein
MSFSAEMKDFIGAWQAGTKVNASQTDADYKTALTDAQKKKTERENDPETLALQDKQARANLAKTNAGIALTQEQVKNAGVSRGYTSALTERMRKAGMDTDQGSGLLPPTMVQPGAAVGGGTNVPFQNTMVPPTIDYAEGGVIPDTEDDGDGDELPVGATPAGPAVGGPADMPTDVSARSRGGGQSGLPQGGFNGIVAPQVIHDATKGAYNYGINAAGLRGGIRSPRQQAAAKALAQGAGALSQQEMDAARKAVDPDGKLTDSQRNMSALGAVYQFWANKGEPEKAQKVAFQMLQHFRNASQRYAAIAAHAAEQGNMDLATKAAVKAYANVPDGRDMTMTVGQDGRVMYHYMDENGKTITKGLATPQELASSAMGLARGGFDQAILSAAGVREEAQKGTGKGAGTSKGNPVTDMKNTGELLDGELNTIKEKWAKKNEGKEPDDNYFGGMRDAATHIMQQNPKMTPREALASAQTLMDPKKTEFKTVSEGGTNKIKFGDGTALTLDDDQFETLITKRAAARKAQLATEDQAKADAAKPSRVGEFVEGAKRVGGAVGDLASEAGTAAGAAGRAVGGAIGRGAQALVPEELAQRVGADVRNAGPVLDELKRPFVNNGAVPPIDSPL